MTQHPRTFPSVPIPVGSGSGTEFPRADIVVSGLEHSGPSYEVRIFLNSLDADADTPQTAWKGYAGSIYVYGYGQPPSPWPADDADVRVAVRPARSIVATDAIRAQARRGREVTVTLVPIAGSGDQEVIDLYAEDVTVRIEEGATPA